MAINYSNAPVELNATCYLGDRFYMKLVVKASDGSIVDFTGYNRLIAQVKESKTALTSEFSFDTNTSSLIVNVDSLEFIITTTQSKALAVGDYYWDLQAINSSGENFTQFSGTFKVTQDTTRL